VKKNAPEIKRWQCHVESGGGLMRDAGIWESVKTDKAFTLTQIEADHSQKCNANTKRIRILLGVHKVKVCDFFGNKTLEERCTALEDYLHLFPSVVNGVLIVKSGYRITPGGNAIPYYFYPLE